MYSRRRLWPIPVEPLCMPISCKLHVGLPNLHTLAIVNKSTEGTDCHVIISFITAVWILFSGINWNMICDFVTSQSANPVDMHREWFGYAHQNTSDAKANLISDWQCMQNEFMTRPPLRLILFICSPCKTVRKLSLEALVPSNTYILLLWLLPEQKVKKFLAFDQYAKYQGYAKCSSQVKFYPLPCEKHFSKTLENKF